MANAWIEVDWIAAESLRLMTDELVIGKLVAVDKTADFNVKPNGYKVGDTVRIKTGPDYVVEEFSSSIVLQDIRSSKRDMTIEKHYDVSVILTAKEMALNFEGFSEEVLVPAATRIAEQIDVYLATKILNARGLYATNNLFTTAADVALARQEAGIERLEKKGRFCLINDTVEAVLLGQTWFNQSQTRGDPGIKTLQEGDMGRVMGMDFFGSINWPSTGNTQTAGAGTGVTDNTGTTNLIGLSVITTDSTSNVFEAGDRIKIAGVATPMRISTQANATATTLLLTDPITEYIPDGAAITVVGSSQSLTFKGAIFDSKSIAVASPMLDPAEDKVSSVINADGYSLRVVRGYTMTTKKTTLSIDILIGAEAYDNRRITLLGEY